MGSVFGVVRCFEGCEEGAWSQCRQAAAGMLAGRASDHAGRAVAGSIIRRRPTPGDAIRRLPTNSPRCARPEIPDLRGHALAAEMALIEW
jgi:hypothetical protein